MKKHPALLFILTATMLAMMGCTSTENTPEPQPQTNPSATPASAEGSLVITATELKAAMDAERIEYIGDCPVSLEFEGVINTQGKGDFSYQFRADANDPDYEFILPDAETINNPTEGEHQLQVTYSLEISESVDGWAFLYIFEPMEFSSNNIDLSINCQ